jgi:hypothetical protein
MSPARLLYLQDLSYKSYNNIKLLLSKRFFQFKRKWERHGTPIFLYK